MIWANARLYRPETAKTSAISGGGAPPEVTASSPDRGAEQNNLDLRDEHALVFRFERSAPEQSWKRPFAA